MFSSIICISAFLISVVQADTEVYDVIPCNDFLSLKDSQTGTAAIGSGWPLGQNRSNMINVRLESDTTMLPLWVKPYDPAAVGAGPCTDSGYSTCQYESNAVLDAEAFCTSSGYDTRTRFMVRISWPASFPVDPNFVIHRRSTKGSSSMRFALQARNRSRRKPYAASSGPTNTPEPTPFIVLVDRFLLGAIPHSTLPLIGLLVAGTTGIGWFANKVAAPWLLTLADKAEEEARLEMTSKGQ